jgi:hypothetical protein
MKNEIEKIKDAIELIYLPIGKQEEKAGYIIGNSNFTDNEISQLNEDKPKREEIYKELELKLDDETYLNVLNTIYNGFIYIADDRGPIEPLAKPYRDAKKRIEKKVKTENKKLANIDSYFKSFPIIIEFKHHLDSPARTGRPPLNRNLLIKDISEHLSDYITIQADRAKLIERILMFFYAVLEHEAKDRNIRSSVK